MQLISEPITFNAATIWNKRGKPKTVRIDAGHGRVFFSAEAALMLGINPGMRLSFSIFPQDGDVIYFFQSDDGIEVKEVECYPHRSGAAIYCRPLAIQLLKHIGFKADKQKTFKVYNETVTIPVTGKKAWMILKSNVHKPIKTTNR